VGGGGRRGAGDGAKDDGAMVVGIGTVAGAGFMAALPVRLATDGFGAALRSAS